jgi:hypothetical protein
MDVENREISKGSESQKTGGMVFGREKNQKKEAAVGPGCLKRIIEVSVLKLVIKEEQHRGHSPAKAEPKKSPTAVSRRRRERGGTA